MFIHPEMQGLCGSVLYLLRVGAYKKSAPRPWLWAMAAAEEEVSVCGLPLLKGR